MCYGTFHHGHLQQGPGFDNGVNKRLLFELRQCRWYRAPYPPTHFVVVGIGLVLLDFVIYVETCALFQCHYLMPLATAYMVNV